MVLYHFDGIFQHFAPILPLLKIVLVFKKVAPDKEVAVNCCRNVVELFVKS